MLINSWNIQNSEQIFIWIWMTRLHKKSNSTSKVNPKVILREQHSDLFFHIWVNVTKKRVIFFLETIRKFQNEEINSVSKMIRRWIYSNWNIRKNTIIWSCYLYLICWSYENFVTRNNYSGLTIIEHNKGLINKAKRS